MTRLLAIALLVAACGGGGVGATTRATDAPDAMEPIPTEQRVDATEAPAAESAFEDISLKGTGAKVVKFTLAPGTAAIVKFGHKGDGNFAVWTVDPSGNEVDLLVNTIGKYSGTVLFNEEGAEVAAFEIEADGPWSSLIRPIERAPAWNPSKVLTGKGDAVYRVTPPISGLTTARLKESGESNFAIWAYTPDSTDLIVNEIGPYTGETLLAPETWLLEITGANWSITATE